MKYRLMDALACPACRQFPLELIILSEEKLEGVEAPEGFRCNDYCGLEKKFIKDIPGELRCRECFSYEIVEGVLYCPSCGRWYPIINKIPRLLPDQIREKTRKAELAFLRKHRGKLPEKIVLEGKPFNLSST